VRESGKGFSEEALRLRVARAGPPDDPLEPNDRSEEAKPAELDIPLGVQLFPAGDIDGFVVTLPSRGFLQCVMNTRGVMLYPEAYVYDEAGRFRGTNECNVPAGRYRIVLQDLLRWSSRQRISVVFQVVDSGDPSEPNDRPEEARVVPLPAIVPFSAGPGDSDWFRFVVPEDGILSVYVKFPAAAFALNGELRRAEGGNGSPINLDWPGVRLKRVTKGAYLLRVAMKSALMPPRDWFKALTLELTHYRKGEPIDLGFRLIGFGDEESPDQIEQLELIAELMGQKLLRGDSVEEAVKAIKVAVTEGKAKATEPPALPEYVPIPREEPKESSGGRRVLAWALVGLSVVLAAGAVFFALKRGNGHTPGRASSS